MGLILARAPDVVQPDVEKTTTVLFRADPAAFTFGDSFLIQAMIPGAVLPDLFHPDTGEKCDLIPAAKDVNGVTDMHQLVCRHTVLDPNQTEIEFTTHPVFDKVTPTEQWDSADFSDISVVIPTTSGTTFTARLGDAMFRKTWRAGMYVNEKEYFVRSTGPLGEKGPGVRFFVDRQINLVVNIYFLIENTMWTPTVANLSGVDPDGTGDVFYSQIDMADVPANYFPVQMEIEQPSSNTGSRQMVKPENVMGGTGPEQLMPAGTETLFAYTFRHASVTTAKATAIGQFVGYGFPQSGDFNVYTGRGYGGARNYGVDFGNLGIAHENTNGKTGLASTLHRDVQYIDYLRGKVSSGQGDGFLANAFFNLDRNGAYYPFRPTGIREAGEAGVELFGLGSLHGDGFRGALLGLKHTMQRHSTGFCDPATGSQISSEDMEALHSNGTAPWMTPFRTTSFSERWNNELPCWLMSEYENNAEWSSTGDRLITRALGQESFAWNKPSTFSVGNAFGLPIAMHMRRTWSKGGGNPSPNKAEGDHHARYFGQLDPLAYGANLGVAKHLILKEGIYAQRCMNQFENDPNYGQLNGGFFIVQGSLKNMRNVVVGAGKEEQAGYGGTAMNRGWGMMTYCVANAYRFADHQGKYRQETQRWLDQYVETFDVVTTTYGAGTKTDANDPQANGSSDFAAQAYPATDAGLGLTNKVLNQGAFALDDNIRTLGQPGIVYETGEGDHWSCMQAFQIGYHHHGTTALMLSTLQPGGIRWNKLKKSTKFLEEMYDRARRPGILIPPSIFPLSKGSNGVNDPVDAQVESWYFNPADVNITFTREWDSRSLFLMGQSMLVADEEGDSVSLAKYLQYIKDFLGVPSGTVQDAIDAVYSDDFRWNGESGAQLYQSEYLRSRYGVIVGVLEGLRNKGSIE